MVDARLRKLHERFGPKKEKIRWKIAHAYLEFLCSEHPEVIETRTVAFYPARKDRDGEVAEERVDATVYHRCGNQSKFDDSDKKDDRPQEDEL